MYSNSITCPPAVRTCTLLNWALWTLTFLVKLQARYLLTRAQFSSEFTRFLEHQFCVTYDYHMLYKINVLKNLAIFTGKLMWTAASGITENIPFTPGYKFSDVLQSDCKSVFKVLSISTEMHFSADLALMSTHPFKLTFIYTVSTIFTFMLHLHFFIYISFHYIGQSHSVLQNHSCMWSCHLPYITKRWWYCRFRLFKSEKWKTIERLLFLTEAKSTLLQTFCF